MAIKIEDIRLWAMVGGKKRGVGCAVTVIDHGGFSHTVCGTYGNYEIIHERPDQICRECRRRLKSAIPVHKRSI